MRKIKKPPKKMFFIFVNDFFNTMRSELHSERTIETYRQSLNAFRFYLSEKYGKGVDQITIDFVTEQMIRDFLVSVADSNSVGTRNGRYAEQYVKDIIIWRFVRPGIRENRTENIYEELAREAAFRKAVKDAQKKRRKRP